MTDKSNTYGKGDSELKESLADVYKKVTGERMMSFDRGEDWVMIDGRYYVPVDEVVSRIVREELDRHCTCTCPRHSPR